MGTQMAFSPLKALEIIQFYFPVTLLPAIVLYLYLIQLYPINVSQHSVRTQQECYADL